MTDTPMDTAQADGWRIIEQEAAEQVRAELQAAENTPLVFGAHIAWVDCMYGRTDALSPIHRVGYPEGRTAVTTCGDRIPAPLLRIVLGPGLLRTMQHCRFCEAEYQRIGRANAA